MKQREDPIVAEISDGKKNIRHWGFLLKHIKLEEINYARREILY